MRLAPLQERVGIAESEPLAAPHQARPDQKAMRIGTGRDAIILSARVRFVSAILRTTAIVARAGRRHSRTGTSQFLLQRVAHADNIRLR